MTRSAVFRVGRGLWPPSPRPPVPAPEAHFASVASRPPLRSVVGSGPAPRPGETPVVHCSLCGRQASFAYPQGTFCSAASPTMVLPATARPPDGGLAGAEQDPPSRWVSSPLGSSGSLSARSILTRRGHRARGDRRRPGWMLVQPPCSLGSFNSAGRARPWQAVFGARTQASAPVGGDRRPRGCSPWQQMPKPGGHSYKFVGAPTVLRRAVQRADPCRSHPAGASGHWPTVEPLYCSPRRLRFSFC